MPKEEVVINTNEEIDDSTILAALNGFLQAGILTKIYISESTEDVFKWTVVTEHGFSLTYTKEGIMAFLDGMTTVTLALRESGN